MSPGIFGLTAIVKFQHYISGISTFNICCTGPTIELHRKLGDPRATTVGLSCLIYIGGSISIKESKIIVPSKCIEIGHNSRNCGIDSIW